MATNVFDLFAKLSLDSSEYENGLNKAKSAASKISGGMASAAKVGLAAVTAAAGATVAFGKSAIDAGQDFDKSMSQVAATMGLNIEEMMNQTGTAMLSEDGQMKQFTGNLRDFAQELGRTTAFTATEAADALNYMALAGYDVQESMDMLPNVLNLAAAGNFDLARASDMVTDTQTAFGIDAQRTTRLVDEMAKAASTGNTSVEQLGDAFLVVGGLAQELNGGMVELKDGSMSSVDGVQELEIALTAMANAGIKGSEAGTHMRNMLLKLSSPTDDGVAALQSMGVAVFDVEGKMRSLKDIFGDLNRVMNEDATSGFKEFYDDLAQVSPEVLAKKFKTKDFEDRINYFGISLVDSQGKLRDYNEVFKEVQSTLGQGLTQEQRIGIISDLFNTRDIASAEALLNAVSQDWDDIGESIINAEGAAQKMKETQLDNLAGDVTLFKSALEGAQIAVSDVLTPALREFVQFGTRGLSKLTGAFKKGGLNEAMGAFGEILAEGLNMFIKKLPQFIDAGIKLLGALGKGMIDNLPVIIDAATNIIEQLSEAFMDGLPIIMQAASDITSGLLAGIKDNLPTILPLITEYITGFAQIIADNAEDFVDIAVAIAGAIGDGLVQATPILLDKVPEIINALVKGFIENPSALIILGPKLIDFLVSGLNGAKSLLKLTNQGKILMGKLGSGISAGGATLTSVMGTTLTGLVGGIAAFFGGAELGKKMGEWIFPSDAELYEHYSGITGTIEMIKDAAISVDDLIHLDDNGIDYSKFTEKVFETQAIRQYRMQIDELTKAYEQGQMSADAYTFNVQNLIESSDVWAQTALDASGKIAQAGEEAREHWSSQTVDELAEHYVMMAHTVTPAIQRVTDETNNLGDATSQAIQDTADKWTTLGTAEDKWGGTMDVIRQSTQALSDTTAQASTDAMELSTSIDGTSESVDNLSEKVQLSADLVASMLEQLKSQITDADWAEIWSPIKTGFDDFWVTMQDRLTEAWGSIKDSFDYDEAVTWGEDLVDNFISGVEAKFDDLESCMSSLADIVKDYVGFSEPKKGPLSNFHTYAPDMMDLFAQGIRDNKDMVVDEFNSMSFSPAVKDGVLGIGSSNPSLVSGSNRQQGNTTVILELDKVELGKAVYNLNNEENQRMGVRLAGGVL